MMELIAREKRAGQMKEKRIVSNQEKTEKIPAKHKRKTNNPDRDNYHRRTATKQESSST